MSSIGLEEGPGEGWRRRMHESDEGSVECPLLLSEVVRPVIEDIGDFLAELEAMQGRLNREAGPLRETMLNEGFILSAKEATDADAVQAVDAASIPLNRQGVAVVLAAGVRLGNEEQMRVEYARRSGENTEDFRRVGTALRLMLEFRLLQDAASTTIIDNSFWSLLMDSNQVLTLWRHLDSNELIASFRDPVEECFGRNGSFIRLLRNPCLIAISKTASSDRISRQRDISPSIPDRTLLTAVLKPGEYTFPLRLSEATRGHFGVEHGMVDYQEVERIYKGIGDRALMVTFYRPWEFQRAYRLEYHDEQYPDGQSLSRLLGQVKHETRERTIMEPVTQYLADMVSKQISEAAPLYIQAALHRYPWLMGPYRTGG